MASIIRIKRSSVSGNPSTLAAGELAYSALTDNGSNGGDRLYIGIGSETAGNAANHFVIGGKYFTDMLDQSPGTLTASSAIVVDSNKKIDDLYVDNLQLNGNTISSTDTNGNILITPNGTGKTVITSPYIGDSSTTLAEYIYDTVGGAITAGTGISVTNSDAGNTSTISLASGVVTAGTYGSSTAIPSVTVDTYGRVTGITTNSISTVLTVTGDSGTPDNVTLGTDTLTFEGGTGIDTTVSNNKISVAIDNTVVTLDGVQTLTNKTITGIVVSSLNVTDSSITFEGATNDAYETTLFMTDPTADRTITFPDATGTVTLLDANQTLTNKTISGSSNTLSNIGNSSLTNSSVTINGTSVSLGGSATVTAAAGTLTGTTLNSTVVTSSLTSVGTIGTGTWQGTTIAVGYGGTGTNNGSITGTGALTFTAGGSNTNVNLAPQGTGTVDVNSKRITNLADPTGAQDAATKAYVDAMQTGLDVKASVRAATTANITLSNTQTVDNVALSVGDRVLVKNQSTGSQNGIYVVASGSWTRATDCDNTPGTEVTSGMFTFVEEGDTNADSGWVLTTDGAITVGSTALTFVQFSGAGQITAGAALTKTGNTLDVAVAASGGIEISGDALQLKSTVAGAGLTLTSGVLAVGAGTGITVNADDIQISASYVGQTSITTLGTITTGTWNGTAIGNSYLANSAVTVNGTSISLGSSATITANTTNAITFNTTGGAASGTTFNGSAARTIDYSTVGAAPAAGNSSITTVGTISSGTWNGTAIGPTYGGTGLTSYTTGDLIYASATNTLSKRAAGTDGQVLQMNSSGVPVWGDIDGGTY